MQSSLTTLLNLSKVTKFSTNISELINNSGVYFLYASVSLFCAIFTTFVVPETKGKSSEEMKAYFTPAKSNEKDAVPRSLKV